MRYPPSIHFHCQNVRKNAKKVSKINLMIISKSHAHPQSMVKTSVKFQRNRNKTVRGVACETYILGMTERQKDGTTEGRKDRGTEGRKATNYVPLLFFEKAEDKNTHQTFYYIHFVQIQSAVIPEGVCKIKLERQLHHHASTKCNKLDRDNLKQVRNSQTKEHQENMFVQSILLQTPILYSKTGVCRGIPVLFFLFLLQNIDLWGLVEAVLTCTHNLCFEQE